MKTRSIASSGLFVGVALLLTWPLATLADTGGGSGRPITPYERDQAPTEADIQQGLATANRTMRVEGVRVQGSNASRSGYQVGFAYVKPGAVNPVPTFELAGDNEQGKPEKIALASIAQITLVSIEKHLTGANEAIIEVEQFPALSPAQLFAAQPTYAILKSQYTRTFRLRVPISSAEGDLSMIGTEWYKEDKYRILFRVADLTQAMAIPLRSEPTKGLWWAIPSVTGDPAYPHRVIMKH